MILIDSNVLVYALNADAPFHGPSRRLVEAGLSRALDTVLLPQIVVETYAILTDHRRVARPLPPAAAWEQLNILRSSLPTLTWPTLAMDLLGRLLQAHALSGQRVFDGVLAAQMLAHGITTLCTYNVRDFLRYADIEVLTPEQLLERLAPPAP